MKFKKLLFPLSFSWMLIISCSPKTHLDLPENQILIKESILNFDDDIDTVFNFEQLVEIFNKTSFFENKNLQEIKSYKTFLKDGKIHIKIREKDYVLSNINNIEKYYVNTSLNEVSNDPNKNSLSNYDYFYRNVKRDEFENQNFINDIENDFKTKNIISKAYPDLHWILGTIQKLTTNGIFQKILPNLIPTKQIRSEQWAEDDSIEQHEYWQWLIKLYLKYFDTSKLSSSIEDVKIKNIKALDKTTVSFNIDLLDKNGKSLISKQSLETKFYLNDFKSQWKINGLSHVGFDFYINDEQKLFNEYLNNPIFSFKENNFFNFNNFDDFIVSISEYDRFTSKAFKFFLEKYFNDLVKLEVPDHKKNEDFKYEILDLQNGGIKYDDLIFKSKQTLKLSVKVTKKNGQTKIYPWYSPDFNLHQHIFKGYKPSDDKLDLLTTKVDDWTWSNESYFDLQNQKVQLPLGLDANSFFEKNILNLLNLQDIKLKERILPFFNKTKKEIDVIEIEKNPEILDYLETYLAKDIFLFLIGNKENNFESGIEKVKISYRGYDENESGIILINIDFLDANGNSLLNKKNKSKIIKYGGFKGFDFKKYNDQYNQNIWIQNFIKRNSKDPDVLDFVKDNLNNLPKIFSWGNNHEKKVN
ncbi:LIPOPROTEIN [Mycoplasmopsis pulmonis]|uniref:LIPOPROTEIN n=1 Tax=Mycoplasmopsis pulmonis (strain UAB CTIP) TaxID=272635 RepID=Q98PW3_MYCPU|nr:hypothetical protein [Mycoplasmopsis pulmonis]MDZ7293593.1 hypothetical protein [Mycoplasmopsis pulmonis]CAC13779.1 LIPOPROTEIN [Mycoplasmopsis pulmonis]VEU68367.1 Uncharacterised protein [Mycoplasmopsis pulmonis]